MAILAGQRVTSLRANDGHPRYINYTALTTTTAVNSTTTDAAGITTPSITFRNGRAFRIAYKGNAVSTSAGADGQFTVRPTSITGTPILLDSQRFGGSNAGTRGFYFENIVSNTSGADVSRVLVGCYHNVTGTNTALGAMSNQPAFLSVEDIGDATDFPSASSLT